MFAFAMVINHSTIAWISPLATFLVHDHLKNVDDLLKLVVDRRPENQDENKFYGKA